MGLINENQNQEPSQDGAENGKSQEISKGDWGVFNSSKNESKLSALVSKGGWIQNNIHNILNSLNQFL